MLKQFLLICWSFDDGGDYFCKRQESIHQNIWFGMAAFFETKYNGLFYVSSTMNISSGNETNFSRK